MFGTFKAKLITAGVVLLGILLAVWRIFAAGKKAGGSAEREKQQRAADKARARMNAVKQESEDEGNARLDRGEF